jgi:hypothetical protein
VSRTPHGDRTDRERPLRVVRAVVLAAVTVACSAAVHTAAGGGLPDAVGVALLGALTLVVTGVLGRWRLTPWTLVPVLGALQVGLHHGFQALSASRAVAPSAATQLAHHAGHEAGHGEPGLLVAAELAAAARPDLVAHAAGHLQPGMLAAHALAVVAITVLAVGSDRALARTVRRFTATLVVLARAGVPRRAPARPVVPVGLVASPLTPALARALPRRGPPAALRTA